MEVSNRIYTISGIARLEQRSGSPEDKLIPGSAGCQPAFVGSLPAKIVFDRLPNTAGKLASLPSKTEGCVSARSIRLAKALFVNRAAAEVEEC